MPGNKCNGNSNSFPVPDRHERLMRGRELRKSSKASPDSNNISERYLEEVAAAAAAARGERKDGRPFRQRLLVVANRLPVSAIRKGEDLWSLEISAGGLVSALLGM